MGGRDPAGGDDRPVANARVLARAVPRSRLRVLEGAGHLVFIEEAEEVRAARQGLAPGGKPEGLLRRLPGHARRLAGKLGDLLTR